ncbi:Arylsulfatase [Posidoniimonas polymericola]|uniref:Arylsulfatase n=1 Tax=Posidoniimonas polymericola TaxID=2528002 RepID=A0A5C5XYU1_9BACT|nr:sulfatase [Posidoniimonas polymericola]TWT67709.1 Arylsulfatase [Posidoniimonas polymericola]
MLLRAALLLGAALASVAAADDRPPNVVVIFIDDMGYADIGPFGAECPTPNLDRMAAEGRLLTDFHAATAVCSASRAALLTGCYPDRVGVQGAYGPHSRVGLNPDEVTIAELCRQRGYATACFGKWHLGDAPQFLPTRQGFDTWFGLPYSNDMWPLHPDLVKLPPDAAERKSRYPKLPLYRDEQIVDPEVTAEDQAQLTTQYTEHAVEFIDQHADQPFFLYLPHSMVHVPIFVSDKFKGKSGAGLFGDVVMEVDWSVGQVLDALEANGIDDNTLVVFTSDNGPWLSYGDHAGSAGPFREGKGTMFEGGYREPFIARWPGKIPAGTTSDELATTMDLLPTIAGLIGAEVPTDRKIDGQDIWPLLSGDADAGFTHSPFYCYWLGELHAVRDNRWKLHFPHKYRTLSGRPGGTGGVPVGYDQATIGLALFDLKSDPGETTNVAAQHPDIVERLQAMADEARADLGDRLTGAKGDGARPVGRVERQRQTQR